MVYETNSEALNFITVRPLYEDARDDAPVVSPSEKFDPWIVIGRLSYWPGKLGLEA